MRSRKCMVVTMNDRDIKDIKKELGDIRHELHQLNVFIAHIAGIIDMAMVGNEQNEAENDHSS